MVPSAAYAIWMACTLIEILACGLIIVRGQLRQHLALWSYLALCVVISALRWQVLHVYGVTSREYLYSYCFSDTLLTIGLFLATMEPYRKLLPGPRARIAVRLVRFGAPILVFLFSAALVSSGGPRVFGRFLVEFSQDLTFVTALLSLVLFYPRLWDRRAPVHVYQLIFLLGAFFLYLLAEYGLRRSAFPPPEGLTAFGIFLLPAGVVYVFSNRATARARPYLWL